ncbi:MAG: FAD-dependent oxidoreductase [Acidobacteriota bacterium]
MTSPIDSGPNTKRLVDDLPEHLEERVRILGGSEGAPDGPFVLYWMRAALRGHENPALDVALSLARRLNVPAFVYHGLDEGYPFASDRHHTFILEGAKDVAAELADRGIGYAFHLQREGHRGPHLRDLATQAAVLVTEDLPVAPLAGWTAGLAGSTGTPVLAVDTACVVPMPLVPRAYDRAFAYRRATEHLRRERLRRPWDDVEPHGPPFVPDLPFRPVDLAAEDPAELLRHCRIDHAVGPVPHTRGGSRAGYARWNAFRGQGLRRYKRDRNDPLRDGASRMSAYLHYGMVSPLRIAREAAEDGGDGAHKYLDELLVWRELAYAFCFHRPGHAGLGGIPDWARKTLADYEGDPRPDLYSWETLARGRTGDPLWDAAQLSLLRQGELHNNVRMTWGKALLGWTPDAETALQLLEDLNHRYALDGRDPASYGGILWCLGQFDRPFTPAKAVLGTVRPRPTSSHARRLDPGRYRRRVAASPFGRPRTAVVVGAGMAGLACARTLADAGVDVTVLDKGRGPGGRTSSRRRGEHRFDHGAQYFTARDPHFRRLVESWHHDGHVTPWTGRVVDLADGGIAGERPADGRSAERWVGHPKMSAVAAHLASDLDVRQSHRVTALTRTGNGGWRLEIDGQAPLSADLCLLTAPVPQTLDLLPEGHPLVAPLQKVELVPCIALMAAFDGPTGLDFDGAFVGGDGPLDWICRDSSKPGRPAGERWVLHASPDWSRDHFDDPRDDGGAATAGALLSAMAAAVGRPLPEAAWRQEMRWRYARVIRPVGRDHLFDPGTGLGYAGDGCLGSRVESAYLSGVALAGAILRRGEGSKGGDGERPTVPAGEPMELPF